MIYSQIGMFMKTELHATESTVAITDGIVEFISFICRIFAGAISDCLRERKLILLFGCFVTLFARSILATVSSWFMVVIIQSIERVGNGFQATPRDALIADLSKAGDRGKSYGFSRSLKTTGSLIGIPIAILIMYLSGDSYRTVFLCATVPVVISIICLLKITPPAMPRSNETLERKKIDNPFQRKYLKSLDIDFWKIMLLAFVFELSHFTETLLPIYASQYLSKTTAGSESIFVSIGQVLLSFPIGLYADRIGKITLIRVCMICMVLADISFIFVESILGVYIGAFLWGGQMTAIQGLFLSIISERANEHIRATAIGIYYCTIGVSYLVASVIAGHIWTYFGGKYAFMYSLCVACLAITIFNLLLPARCEHKRSYT
jgi:MFS family permease